MVGGRGYRLQRTQSVTVTYHIQRSDITNDWWLPLPVEVCSPLARKSGNVEVVQQATCRTGVKLTNLLFGEHDFVVSSESLHEGVHMKCRSHVWPMPFSERTAKQTRQRIDNDPMHRPNRNSQRLHYLLSSARRQRERNFIRHKQTQIMSMHANVHSPPSRSTKRSKSRM